MGEEPIYSDKDVFEQGAAGMVATLALVASTAGASLPAQGAMAAVGSFVGLGMGRYVYRAAHRRFPKFALGFLHWYDPDPERARTKAQQSAEEHKDDPDYHEVMYRAFKLMMDAADESVVPTIRRLGGLYTSQSKKPDAFFRGLGRLLCDLEGREVDQLQAIVGLALKIRVQGALVDVRTDGADQLFAYSTKGTSDYDRHSYPSAKRMFMLLKREGLGENKPPVIPDDDSAPDEPEESVRLDLIAASRMMDVLEPPWRSRLPLREKA